MRGVATSIAIVVLFGGIASGFLYQRFWQTASHEVERLLPASTVVHIHGSKPAPGLAAALDMPHLRDVSLSSLLEEGIQSWGMGAALAPLSELLAHADDLHFATIPANDALGFLVFVEIRDDKKRLGYEDRLAALMVPVDRELGFTVRALSAPRTAMPWAPKTLPLRMVSMEPWLVFSLGPRETLSQLLQARVSGTAQPIRTRQGYARLAEVQASAPGDVVAYLAPGPLHDALREETARETLPSSVIAMRRALLVEGIEAFTAQSYITGDRTERLSVTAHLEQSDDWPELTEVFTQRGHQWIAEAPAGSEWVASLALEAPDKVRLALASVATRVERQFGRSLELSQLDLVSALGRTARSAELRDRMQAFTGHVRLIGLAADEPELTSLNAGRRWMLSMEGTTPKALTLAADAMADALRGETHAIGTLYRTDGAVAVNLAMPHSQSTKPEPRESLAWRVTSNVLEIAPNREVFAAVDRTTRDGDVLGNERGWRRIAADLPTDSGGLLMVHPSLLRQSALGAAVASTLDDDFRLVARLEVSARSASVTMNIGVWTSVIALARAPRRMFDRLLLPNTSRDCLSALDSVCRRLPSIGPCTLWSRLQPGVMKRACHHLTASDPI